VLPDSKSARMWWSRSIGLSICGMPYATAPDSARIYYEAAGSGDPLLLIHGQASDSHAWDPVRDDFAARHRVIVYDHRGTGESDRPAHTPYTTRGFAADAVAILDHMGVERAHAYGTSMGGRITQWLGIDHGSRMGALVLGCTTPGDIWGVARSAEVDAAFREKDPARRIELLFGEMFTPAFAQREPALARRTRANMIGRSLPTELLAMHYQCSQGHDAWAELPRIKNPVLVIHGSEDRVNPTANAQLLVERIPGAELHLVEGARHGYQIECRAEATPVVLDFLARHPITGRQ
jgi:3-oxoadipate enol-lactonase